MTLLQSQHLGLGRGGSIRLLPKNALVVNAIYAVGWDGRVFLEDIPSFWRPNILKAYTTQSIGLYNSDKLGNQGQQVLCRWADLQLASASY